MAETHARRALRWLPFIGGCAVIWILSDMPRPPIPAPLVFPHADKLMHAAGYAGLCALAIVGATRRRLALAFLLTCAWGAIDELHQGFVPGRERSALDLVADAVGGAAVVLVVHRWARRAGAPQPS